MKKQNVNAKLTFKKSALAELNDNQLYNVNGGSGDVTSAVLYSAYVAIEYIVSKFASKTK